MNVFDDTSNWLHFDLRTLAIDVAAAIGCTVLAILYFAAAFAAGESPQPTPISVSVFLWVIALAVAVLGAVLASITKHFPWLVAVLTPLFLAGFFRSVGERDAFVSNLKFGGMASGLFLIGALAACGIKLLDSRTQETEGLVSVLPQLTALRPRFISAMLYLLSAPPHLNVPQSFTPKIYNFSKQTHSHFRTLL